MKTSLLLLAAIFCSLFACTQSHQNSGAGTTKRVGGPCEGCEAIYESPLPFDQLNWADTLPDFNQSGPKLLVRGTVYHKNGTSPAANVVVYVYHTDQKGVYPTTGNESGWARRHGYLRGWAKTNAQGQYAFYTLKPAPYPGGNAPAHIHMTIKEADKNEYWIDEILFDDDPLVKNERLQNRGSSGLVHLKQKNGLLIAERNIVLGKNIPDYE